MEEAGGGKKMLATLVGCNYAGNPEISELHGCINDAHTMHALLLDHFGFAPDDITVLTDDHDDPEKLPTGATVKRVLSDMVARAAPGDVLFFFFSGHGTNYDSSGRGNEAIVPCDSNLITDVDFQELMKDVPQGATFTMVSDSCYSGGLFDEEKEQIGPNGATDRSLLRASAPGGRFVPYATVLAHLSAASGLDPSHHVGVHLVALFGDDASTKFQPHYRNSSGIVRTADADAGILLSGCQANELSLDMGGDVPCGAFTYSLQTLLNAHPAPMSNRELMNRAREEVRRAVEELIGEPCKQHPCLYCSDANADASFLGQQETWAENQEQLSQEEEAAVPGPAGDQFQKRN